MVAAADRALTGALLEKLGTAPTFTLALAKRALLVDGEVMPPNSAVVQEIGTRLHLMGIGAVRFHQGLTRESVSLFVQMLARRAGDPSIDAPLPELTGIAIGRMSYDQLGLADEESMRAETTQLWHTMAERLLAAAGADGISADDEAGSEPRTLGAAFSHATSDDKAAGLAFDALRGLSDRVALAPGSVRATIGERLQALLSATDQGAVIAALRAASQADRARVVSNVVEVLPAAAVVRWLNAAAQASGKDLSPHLLRLLTKMSVHFRGRRPESETEVLRETAHELVNGWELTEPNPEEHATLLDTLAAWTARDGFSSVPSGGQLFDPTSHEAARLMQMAIELDYVSEDAANAVRRLADQGHTSVLLAWIERAASEGTRTALRDHMLTPTAILRVLLADPLDAAEAKKLLDITSASNVSVLVEALEQCESRAGRRLIFDRLRTLPSSAAYAVRDRITQPMPWYLARNLLALLRDYLVADPSLAGAFTPGPLLLFQKHEHVAVRREAIRLLAQFPTLRASALRRAFDDNVIDVQQTAIDVAYAQRQQELPAEVALRLLALAERESLEMAFREKAVRAVSGSMHADVRAWLVAHATRRTRLLGGVKLAPATDTVRAAVQVLAAHAAADRDVQPLIALARKAGLLGGAT